MTADLTPKFTVEYVTSSDSTRIGYRRFGSGPAALLIHGAGASAKDFTNLALSLADEFTVLVPDRRGRGSSGPFGDSYTARTEVDDVLALLAATGATNRFGHSSGALLALEAALLAPSLTKLALYEPPLSINHSVSTDWVTIYDQQISAGNLAGAMVTALRGTKTAPTPLRHAPRAILEPLLRSMLRRSASAPHAPGDGTVADIVPTLHYDALIVAASEGRLEAFSRIDAQVLLLGGGKSPAYLKTALAGLERTLPHSQRIQLRASGHAAPDNNSQPTFVGEKLRAFFQS
jgi:pimeloyl-ACP methyl ester carboxylesterase